MTHRFEWGQCPECWAKTLKDEDSPEEITIGIRSLKKIDDVDTRREILHCLSKLSEFERTSFLYWCGMVSHQFILATSEPPWTLFEIRNPTGNLVETFVDFCSIIANFGLPLNFALRKLEEMASKKAVVWTP